MPVSAGAGNRRTWPYTPVWRPTPSADDSRAMLVWNIIPKVILACCSPMNDRFVLYYQQFIGDITACKSAGVAFAQHFVVSACLTLRCAWRLRFVPGFLVQLRVVQLRAR